ncbi:MAG: flagellar assembly protein FliW [Defluviitaleaceae bacterium]|nr:flagellar assembly protein FliW [Defluviitaleaceae bacterium]
MKLSTTFFGEIEIPDDKVITFDIGLPAFPDEKSFVIIHDEENEDSIFCWLQSTTTPVLVFPIMDTISVLSDYSPHIPEKELMDICEKEDDDLFIYNIATIKSTVTDITVNLKAPVIINLKTKKGRQFILEDDKYSIHHKVFEEIQKRKKV